MKFTNNEIKILSKIASLITCNLERLDDKHVTTNEDLIITLNNKELENYTALQKKLFKELNKIERHSKV